MEVVAGCRQSRTEEGFERETGQSLLLVGRVDGGREESGGLAKFQRRRLGNIFLIHGHVGVLSLGGDDLTLIVDDPGRDPDVESICALTCFANSSYALGFPLLPESLNPLRTLPPPLLHPERDPDRGSSSPSIFSSVSITGRDFKRVMIHDIRHDRLFLFVFVVRGVLVEPVWRSPYPIGHLP